MSWQASLSPAKDDWGIDDIKNITISLIVLLVLQIIFPDGGNEIVSSVMLFCQALTTVTVIMICMTSTGLLYKLRKSSKEISIPKPVLMITGAIIAFVAAFIIKNLFSLIF